MKIHSIKNIPNSSFLNIKTSQNNPVASKNNERISFSGNAEYRIIGISEEFYDLFFRDMPSDLPKEDLLSKNGKFSPELGYMFVQLFASCMEKNKKDNLNLQELDGRHFAFEYAQNVMYAHKSESGEYNFQNLKENSELIYDIQKAGNAGDMSIFIYSAKNNDGYFSPKLAKSLLKIMNNTNCPSVIDAKLFTKDYCLDDSGNVKEENINLLIKLINIIGVDDIDWYHPCFYNQQTKEIMPKSVEAIEFIYNFFCGNECKNNKYKGFNEDLKRFALVLLLNSKEQDTNYLDEKIFYPRFENIKLSCSSDCKEMVNKVLHPRKNN